MKSHFLRLGQQTLVYGIGAVAQQILGVITLPIYARVFDPSAYGVVEVITVGLSIVVIMIDLGLTSAAQRSYFDYDDSQEQARRVVLSTWMAPSMVLATAFGAAIAAANHPIAVALFSSGRYGLAVLLTGLALPALTLAVCTREVMRLRFQPWHYLGSSLVTGVIGTVVSVTLVLATHLGVAGVFAGMLAGNVLAAIYGLIVSLPHLTPRLSRRELRIMVAFGVPLIPSAISAWALQFVDRILLTKLASLKEVGEYAVANRLALGLLLIVSAFGIAYSPFMLSLHSEDPEAERQVRARLLTYVTAGLMAIAVVLALFSREIVAVIAPSYHKTYQAVALVCLGTVALGVSQVTMSEITLTRRTKLFALYAVIAAVINLGLNFALIPPWGQVGAAVATAVGYIALALLYHYGAQRVASIPTPYENRKLIAISILGIALMPVGLLGSDTVWDLLAKIGGVLALLVGMWVIGVLGREEISAIEGFLARARKPRSANA